VAADGWTRNDNVRMSQRAKDGVKDTSKPQLKIPVNSSIHEYALHFLPMQEIDALAAKMTAAGVAKFQNGQRAYKDWNVTRTDVLKWMGAWMYMLAFPLEADRRAYFTGFEAGFGPTNVLEKYGVHEMWFEMMQTCFELPTYGRKDDAFDPVRRWWDSLRLTFAEAIDAGYILNLDESMLRWLGQHMPGFMSVGRKPDDKGAELHTVCDGQSGIMVNFELYEGKEAMKDREYCRDYQATTATTLRLVKPFKGLGKIAVADSWFGSVQSARGLYDELGTYAVLNVKTAHTGYPKKELFEIVWSMSNGGNPSKKEAKELSRFPKHGGKRGLHAGFVKLFDIKGGETIEMLAAGHNAKKPMLLISTAGNLLPGNPQVKEWYDAERVKHSHTTPQPHVHEIYRTYFHLVDDHNQLRSGAVTMADVWETMQWPHRHFAESLGMWEVNVYKALVAFHPQYKELKHPRFRRLLAHALLTGGQPLVIDVDRAPAPPTPTRTLTEGHLWHSFDHRSVEAGGVKSQQKHTCGFCTKATSAYGFCAACFPIGSTPTFAICGPSTGRNCMQQHANGVQPRHTMQKRKRESGEGPSSAGSA